VGISLWKFETKALGLFAMLTVVALGVGGCLSPSDSKSSVSKLGLTGVARSTSKGAKIAFHIPAKSTTASASGGTSSLLSTAHPGGFFVASDLGDFDCFAINVIAADIKKAPACGGEIELGVTTGFLRRGQTLELDVPLGFARTFQVLAFSNSDYCPDVVHLLTTPYRGVPDGIKSTGFILAQKTVDVLTTSMTIDMSLSFTYGATATFCGPIPNPDTTIQYAKLDPGTETSSLQSRDITSNTTDLCIAYTTTALSPQFTCYLDDVAVTCDPGACNPYTGGYVQQVTNSYGTHTFKISTVDSIYNLSDPSPATFIWTMDNIVPTFTITGISNGSLNATGDIFYTRTRWPNIGLNVSKAGSAYFDLSGTFLRCNSTNYTGNLNCPAKEQLAVGANAVDFRYIDRIGLQGVDLTTTIFVDNTHPGFTTTPAADGSNNVWLWGGLTTAGVAASSTGMSIAGTDAAGEVNTTTLKCSIDSGTTAACPTAPTTFDFGAGANGGKHTVYATVNDYAGNPATPVTFNIFVDSLIGMPVLGRLYPAGSSVTSSYLNNESDYSLTTIANLPGNMGFNSPGQTALDVNSNRLFVTDILNHRIMVFTWNPYRKSVQSYKAVDVIGQVDSIAYNPGLGHLTQTSRTTGSAVTYTGLNTPAGIAYAAYTTNYKLFVSDALNNRILRFDVAGGTITKQADLVLGQADFTSNAAGATATTLDTPMGLYFHASANRLYAVDSGNCRVVYWDNATTTITDGAAITDSIGSCGGATTMTMTLPTAVTFDTVSDVLYIVDNGNDRVLAYDNGSTAVAATAASRAFGQQDAAGTTTGDGDGSGGTGGAPNNPSLTDPYGVAVVTASSGSRYLAVSMTGTSTSKVKFFDLTTRAVVAQYSASGITGTTPTKFANPGFLSWDSATATLFVSDIANHRVSLFPFTSLSSDVGMNDVIGHSDYSGTSASFYAGAPNSPNDATLAEPSYVVADTTYNRLYVSDTYNNRVLVYVLDPTTRKPRSPKASYVLGVPQSTNLTTPMLESRNLDGALSYYPATSKSLRTPKGLALDGAKNLYVADYTNNRVVRFPTGTSSISNGMTADLVLGQANFTASSSGAANTEMSGPSGVAYDTTANRLFVTDTGNNRVQVFTSITASGAAAFTSIYLNGGASPRNDFNAPTGIAYTAGVVGVVNQGLFIADTGNHRVRYIDISTGLVATNYTAKEDGYYGQRGISLADMGDVTSANGVTNDLTVEGAYSMLSPEGVFFDETKSYLYVADTGNKRVVVYDLTVATNQPANAAFFSTSANSHVMGATNQLGFLPPLIGTRTAFSAGLSGPVGIFRLPVTGGTNLLYIADKVWHRVGVYEVP